MALPSPVLFLSVAVLLLASTDLCEKVACQSAKESPCIVEDIGTPAMPSCVIHFQNGIAYIPKKLWMYPSFNRYGLAPFTIQDFGRVYINHAGRVVIRDVALNDNAPDDFHHGLVRIHRGEFWGYSDPSGQIVVPLKYSCALNYEDKYQDYGPLVCVDCRIEQLGEYSACKGGKWLRADIQGHLTPAPSP